MAVVAEEKIDQDLRKALAKHDVLEKVNNIDLFLTPEGVLAEIILRDASGLEQAQQAVCEAEREFEREHISLLTTVRAWWEVEVPQKIASSSPPGVPTELVTHLFKANLKSGGRIQEVWVSITPSALRILRSLAASDQALASLVRAFLRHRLSIGGAGYWDPVRDHNLELSEGSAEYLRWRPYEQLKTSVESVFQSTESVDAFLQSLKGKGKNSRKFSDVLDALGGPGGAFAPGERFPTSNDELYAMLLEPEKKELEQYYLQALDEASARGRN
ncbi:MAG: hypothetical protein ACRD2G_10655 [Terriglobia bacterium]